MTCKEKLMKEYPDTWESMVYMMCPSEIGYLDDPLECGKEGVMVNNCLKCWDREIPESVECSIKDSGERREFSTGAVRDIQKGKGRCDLLPLWVVARIYDMNRTRTLESQVPYEVFNNLYAFTVSDDIKHLLTALRYFCDNTWETMLLEVSKHFEDGAKKYGEYNWKKGIPTHCYIDSAIRHYLKYLRGDKDEPHDRAFVWNILCCIWTCVFKPELDDYKVKTNTNEKGE